MMATRRSWTANGWNRAGRRMAAAIMLPAAVLFAPMLLAALCSCGEQRASRDGDTGAAGAEARPSTERILVLGGAIGEIIYSLGSGSSVVAADITCTYPEALHDVPKVGYQRTISAEQALALNPTLVLASEEAGPPAALEQLRSAGVRVVTIRGGHDVDGAIRKIAAVAEALGCPERGRALIDSLRRDLAASARDTAQRRAIYVHARGGSGLQVAGSGTAADAMLRLAGAVNCVQEFAGYKPLTAEAALATAPEVIVISAAGLQSLGGIDALLRTPGIAGTPAARSRSVVAVDDLYMLGFGPRLGLARADLVRMIRRAGSGGAR